MTRDLVVQGGDEGVFVVTVVQAVVVEIFVYVGVVVVVAVVADESIGSHNETSG